MKLKFAPVLFGLFASLSAQASEPQAFIGVGINDGVSSINNRWEFNPSVRIGANFNDYHRLYSYLEFQKDAYNFVASYDYFIPLTNSKNWRFFIGASSGIQIAESSKDDLILGAQTGINYRINKNFNTELGYRVHDTRSVWKERNMSQLDTFYISLDFAV
ncbi:hypothetical protein C9J44_03265 [Photobacterium sp. GB-27]|uniref:outer membrane beta-barrel protein n=1 Tax=unclassified Photobacterium TaxID=2628852 RepID=UPI000D15B1BA|nr:MULTISPECIES: outer membrane beta-barrel protein [unclassified Photobacterium]PSV28206.1 hypothetical protein C9J42_03315 [Photobacterium sp. GB-56]PSV38828.1 hypothetical protein C9J44_03265 [Photobacterium sp. GB-27]PSV47131.1 hypothetical protein C9J46_02525 [Photobacterium sp. GB-36]PSV58363.1 hypothetical protein C9J43_03120 [Photobacterium sp. GB-3]PSW74865.1 hypothetical protein C9J41_04000 [Photobacterium sp. GB-50]